MATKQIAEKLWYTTLFTACQVQTLLFTFKVNCGKVKIIFKTKIQQNDFTDWWLITFTPNWQDHEELMKMFPPPPLTFHPTPGVCGMIIRKGGGTEFVYVGIIANIRIWTVQMVWTFCKFFIEYNVSTLKGNIYDFIVSMYCLPFQLYAGMSSFLEVCHQLTCVSLRQCKETCGKNMK